MAEVSARKQSRRRTGLAARLGVVGVSIGLAIVAAVPGAVAAPRDPSSRSLRGGHTSGPSPLVDHGGKILPASNTYAIFWGSSSAFPSDAVTGMSQLLDGLGGSSYLATATQYMRGASTTSTFKGVLTDPGPPPGHSPAVSAIVNEVAKELGTNPPDPTAVYIVYTSNFPKVHFCAWHASGTIAGVTVQVAYVPNTTGVAGCDPGNLYSTSYTEGTRSLADSTAHEFMESITDPVPLSGWADKSGEEIGDKCNFTYSAPVTLHNGSVWQLQEEWSNSSGGCVQTTP